MLIDCQRCTGRGSHCHDCVVSFLLDSPQSSIDLTDAELDAVSVLADQGVVPPLRLHLIVGTTAQNHDESDDSVRPAPPRAASR
jgi:hypothetical protein